MTTEIETARKNLDEAKAKLAALQIEQDSARDRDDEPEFKRLFQVKRVAKNAVATAEKALADEIAWKKQVSDKASINQ